jgi:hypothetical protein
MGEYVFMSDSLLPGFKPLVSGHSLLAIPGNMVIANCWLLATDE